MRVEHQRALEGAQPRVAPERVAEAVLVAPAVGLDRDGGVRGGSRFVEAAGAREQKRPRRVRFGQTRIQLGRVCRVVDARRERRRVGIGRHARHLVSDEFRAREPGVRDRVARVARNRAREVGDGVRDEIGIEALDLEPALGVGAVGLEVGGLAHAQPRRVREAGHVQLASERRDDPVLQREHVFERAVDLRVGDRLAPGEIDEPRRNAQERPDALVAARHQERRVERGGHLVHRAVRAPRGLDDAPAIDDAEVIQPAEIARDGLGNAGAKPRDVRIFSDVREVEDGDGGLAARRMRRRRGGSGWRRDVRASVVTRLDWCDEAVPAPRDRADIGRRGRQSPRTSRRSDIA